MAVTLSPFFVFNLVTLHYTNLFERFVTTRQRQRDFVRIAATAIVAIDDTYSETFPSPVGPEYDGNYRFRSYRFVERANMPRTRKRKQFEFR